MQQGTFPKPLFIDDVVITDTIEEALRFGAAVEPSGKITITWGKIKQLR